MRVKGGTYSRSGYQRGHEHHNAKLTPEDVKCLRELRLAGASYSELAKSFGVSVGHAYRIVTKKAWADV